MPGSRRSCVADRPVRPAGELSRTSTWYSTASPGTRSSDDASSTPRIRARSRAGPVGSGTDTGAPRRPEAVRGRRTSAAPAMPWSSVASATIGCRSDAGRSVSGPGETIRTPGWRSLSTASSSGSGTLAPGPVESCSRHSQEPLAPGSSRHSARNPAATTSRPRSSPSTRRRSARISGRVVRPATRSTVPSGTERGGTVPSKRSAARPTWPG